MSIQSQYDREFAIIHGQLRRGDLDDEEFEDILNDLERWRVECDAR